MISSSTIHASMILIIVRNVAKVCGLGLIVVAASSCSQSADILVINTFGQEVLFEDVVDSIHHRVPANGTMVFDLGFESIPGDKRTFTVSDVKGKQLESVTIASADREKYFIQRTVFVIKFGPGPSALEHVKPADRDEFTQ